LSCGRHRNRFCIHNAEIRSAKETKDYLSEPSDDVAVRIPKELHDEITKSLQGKGFSTVDEFVVYVLRVTMGKPAEDLDKEDTKTVTERLKRLGYI
jgi:hypothetical protein